MNAQNNSVGSRLLGSRLVVALERVCEILEIILPTDSLIVRQEKLTLEVNKLIGDSLESDSLESSVLCDTLREAPMTLTKFIEAYETSPIVALIQQVINDDGDIVEYVDVLKDGDSMLVQRVLLTDRLADQYHLQCKFQKIPKKIIQQDGEGETVETSDDAGDNDSW